MEPWTASAGLVYRFVRLRTRDKNSSRVARFERNSPSMQELTATEFCFPTPRIIMQRWRASMTTPTQRGLMTSWMVFAI